MVPAPFADGFYGRRAGGCCDTADTAEKIGTFADEYEGLLLKHSADYDPRFFLDGAVRPLPGSRSIRCPVTPE